MFAEILRGQLSQAQTSGREFLKNMFFWGILMHETLFCIHLHTIVILNALNLKKTWDAYAVDS